VFIFAGPFLLIFLMKRKRRRSRKEHESEFARIVGAWEEYVDVSLDYGAPMPRNKTRVELARDSGNPEIMQLAELANEMAYGSSDFESVDITAEELEASVKQSWEVLEAELNRLVSASKRVDRIRATFSLRSFIRAAKPNEQLKKLTGKLRFSQTGNVSEGSGISALFQMITRQLRSFSSKK
jgi:D-ribose pyranose/furanose isomerase RbsD